MTIAIKNFDKKNWISKEKVFRLGVAKNYLNFNYGSRPSCILSHFHKHFELVCRLLNLILMSEDCLQVREKKTFTVSLQLNGSLFIKKNEWMKNKFSQQTQKWQSCNWISPKYCFCNFRVSLNEAKIIWQARESWKKKISFSSYLFWSTS